MAKKKRSLAQSSGSAKKVELERGDDVLTARDRLKGALQDLFNSDDDSSSSQEDQQEPTAASSALSPEEDAYASLPKPISLPAPIKRERPTPTIIRRRTKRARMGADVSDAEIGFHHTFVMKLYDRSVDLAQFKDDTPLYPICRAWIANRPRVPPPKPDVEIKKEAGVSGDERGENSKDGDVWETPAPTSPPWTNRFPAATTPALQGVNLDYSSDTLPTTDELLRGHLQRWGDVRRQWVRVAQINEARFNTTGRVLTAMYKKYLSTY